MARILNQEEEKINQAVGEKNRFDKLDGGGGCFFLLMI